MPEGDAVLRTARRLHTALAGRTLEAVDLRWGRVDAGPLVGAVTTEVVAVGKNLLHRTDSGWTLHSHLRMDGSWRVTQDAERVRRAGRSPTLRARLAAGGVFGLGDDLGALEVLRTRDEHRLIGHLGPDVLGGDWDENRAVTNLLASGGIPIAQALLDQRNLAGLGTIFTSEPLFMEGLHPWRSAAELGEGAVRAVVRRASTLLHRSMEVGAPTPTGDPREPTFVFGRRGLPCRRCGRPVRMAQVGPPTQERVLCYCATCQGGLAPGDDGRVQPRLRPKGAR